MTTDEQTAQARMNLAEALTDTSRSCDRLRKRLELTIMMLENGNLELPTRTDSIARCKQAIVDVEQLNKAIRRMTA